MWQWWAIPLWLADLHETGKTVNTGNISGMLLLLFIIIIIVIIISTVTYLEISSFAYNLVNYSLSLAVKNFLNLKFVMFMDIFGSTIINNVLWTLRNPLI